MDMFTNNMIKRAEMERNQSDKMKLFLLEMTTDNSVGICQEDNSTCLKPAVSLVHSTCVGTGAVAVDASQKSCNTRSYPEVNATESTEKSSVPPMCPDVKRTWEYKNQNNKQTNLNATINYIRAAHKSRSKVHRSDTFTKVCSERHTPTADEVLSDRNLDIETQTRERHDSYDFDDGEMISSTPTDVDSVKISESSEASNSKSVESHGNVMISTNWSKNRSSVSKTTTIFNFPETDDDSTRSYVDDEEDHGLISSYDADEFLGVALGSENGSSQLLIDCTLSKTIDQTNAVVSKSPPIDANTKKLTRAQSENVLCYVASQYNSPVANQMRSSLCALYDDSADDTLSSPFAIQRTLKQHRTLTKLQRKSLVPTPIKNKRKISLLFPNEKKSPNLQLLDSLLQEVSIQQAQITQASKAIEYCRMSKEFNASEELVEAERLLLIALLRRQAALDRSTHLKLGDSSPEELKEQATVSLTNIFLPLKMSFLENLDTSGMNVWFIAVASSKENVLATKAVCQVENDGILLSNQLLMPKIMNNFKIRIDIYSFRLRRTEISHENKYHLSKKHRKKAASKSKLMISASKLRQCLARNDIPQAEAVSQSSFRLAGSLEIQVEDLYLERTRLLSNVPLSSPIEGSLGMNIETFSSRVFVNHDGFLNMLTFPGGAVAWKLAWFKLSGHMLEYWNCPSDEDEKNPLGSIDLRKCVPTKIEQVDRELCPRAFTFLIEIPRPAEPDDYDNIVQVCKTNCTIVRHFLSASSKDEFQEWCQKLTYVVATLTAFTRSPTASLQMKG